MPEGLSRKSKVYTVEEFGNVASRLRLTGNIIFVVAIIIISLEFLVWLYYLYLFVSLIE